MMKKKYLNKISIFFFCLLLFNSCTILFPELKDESNNKIVAIYLNNELTYTDNCEKFIFRNNTIYLPCIINNIYDTVFFDTGAPGYLSVEETLPDSSYRIGELKTLIDERSIFYDVRSDILKNKLFLSTSNPTIVYFSSEKLPFVCEPKDNRYKTLGFSILPGKKAISIRFSDTTICVYNKTSYDRDGYSLVKSKFINGKLFIYLTINGIEYDFLFDTGSDAGLMLSLDSYPDHKHENDHFIEGVVGRLVVGDLYVDTMVDKSDLLTVYLNKKNAIQLAGNVFFLKNLKHNNIGMHIISNYDWIIDSKKKKVWFKPIQINNKTILFSDTLKKEKSQYQIYHVDIDQNSLYIAARNLSVKPKFPLNAIIRSVNGIEINNDNICYYKDLLNKTWDWSNIQIELIFPE